MKKIATPHFDLWSKNLLFIALWATCLSVWSQPQDYEWTTPSKNSSESMPCGGNLRNPRMIGFGISNKQTLKAAQDNAAGAIIGSKFVTLLNEAEGNADVALDRLFDALAK